MGRKEQTVREGPAGPEASEPEPGPGRQTPLRPGRLRAPHSAFRARSRQKERAWQGSVSTPPGTSRQDTAYLRAVPLPSAAAAEVPAAALTPSLSGTRPRFPACGPGRGQRDVPWSRRRTPSPPCGGKPGTRAGSGPGGKGGVARKTAFVTRAAPLGPASRAHCRSTAAAQEESAMLCGDQSAPGGGGRGKRKREALSPRPTGRVVGRHPETASCPGQHLGSARLTTRKRWVGPGQRWTKTLGLVHM